MTQPAPQPAPPQAVSRSGLIRDIVVNAVLPYATYLGLTAIGVATVPALVTGAIFPVASVLFNGGKAKATIGIGRTHHA